MLAGLGCQQGDDDVTDDSDNLGFRAAAGPSLDRASPCPEGTGRLDATPPPVATPTPVQDVPTSTRTREPTDGGVAIQPQRPTPTPRVTPNGGGGTGGGIRDGTLLQGYAFPVPIFEQIAWCESTMNPSAISWDGSSYGLMQINSIHAHRFPDFWESWMIPERNIQMGYELYLESGLSPWASSAGCWR